VNDVRTPPGVVLVPLREADAVRCAALEGVLFPGDDPWSAAAFRTELRAGHTYLAAWSTGGARRDTARSGGGAREDTARSGGGAREDTARSGGAREDAARGPGGTPWGDARGDAGTAADTARGDGGALSATTRGAGGAGDGDLLVGYAGIAFVAGPPRAEAEIHTLGVDPAFRGRGIGRALLRALLAVADREHATVFLEVRTDNEAALALYRAEGFAVVGLRRRYYRPSGADAHTMRREAR
jgi:ribosomal-protein-alanine acetyltransferase